MTILTDKMYLSDVKKVVSIVCGYDESDKTMPYNLKMDYVRENNSSYVFTMRANNNKTINDIFKNLVEQIRAQDRDMVDKAFEDAILK
jgi:RNA binding exosome subunit